MSEFAPRPETGRVFGYSRRVQLGDVDPDAVVRLDALARFLQDVAGDDWEDAAGTDEDVWVVRRTRMSLSEHGRWPRMGEDVRLDTWCAGTGAAWAERRTDLSVEGAVVARTSALWVPVSPTDGHPRRLRESFFAVYGDEARRRVSGRVEVSDVAPEAMQRQWVLRRADLDVVGHVNNAAVWEAVSEVVDSSVRTASVVHHGSLEAHEDVVLHHTPGRLWLLVHGEVRVAAHFSP